MLNGKAGDSLREPTDDRKMGRLMQSSLARKMLAAAGACIGLWSCAALADDVKPIAVHEAESDHWSGPYIGLIAGGAVGRTSANSAVDCQVNGFLCDPVHYPAYGALIGATASGSKSEAAFFAGATAG